MIKLSCFFICIFHFVSVLVFHDLEEGFRYVFLAFHVYVSEVKRLRIFFSSIFRSLLLCLAIRSVRTKILILLFARTHTPLSTHTHILIYQHTLLTMSSKIFLTVWRVFLFLIFVLVIFLLLSIPCEHKMSEEDIAMNIHIWFTKTASI